MKAVLTSAVLWFYLAVICAAVCLLAGINVLVGFGWTLLAGCVAFAAMAWLIRTGMSNG
jgi:hypothetical protein